MTRPAIGNLIHSIRFRLTALYSVLLFALGALMVGAIYLAVASGTDAHPITKTFEAKKLKNGQYVGRIEVAAVREVESAVNYATLENLRLYSLVILGGLFVASLGIGWIISGRALRPVGEIARTAAEIQSTDLSRRIRLTGPRDELRRLGDTIDSMLDRLEEAFRAQRQLIDDASHELRTPLTIIRANVDAVLASPRATAEERRRAAAIVDRATTRMTRLVEDLLATARRSAPALGDGDVDLAAVVEEACEDFGTVASSRPLAIRRTLAPGLTLVGDHDALRRAVGNLLSNAVRLAPAGSEITVGAGRHDGWLWAAVKDAGPGIAEEDQGRIFDRFWRGSEPGSGGRDRRTGLGLAIVRQIAESHGGRVRVFSRLGAGSTFVLWMPSATDERTAGGHNAPPDENPL